jgi:hypothetical protein
MKSIYNINNNVPNVKSLYYVPNVQEQVTVTNPSSDNTINFISSVRNEASILPASGLESTGIHEILSVKQIILGNYLQYGNLFILDDNNLGVYNESINVGHSKFSFIGLDNINPDSNSSLIFHCKYDKTDFDNTTELDKEILIYDSKLRVSGISTFIESNKTSIKDNILTVGYINKYNFTNKDTLQLSFTDDVISGYSKGIDFEYIDNNSLKIGFMGYDFSTNRFVFYKEATYENHNTSERNENKVLRKGNITNVFNLDEIYTNKITTSDVTGVTSMDINATSNLNIFASNLDTIINGKSFYSSSKSIFINSGDNTIPTINDTSSGIFLYGKNNETVNKKCGIEIGYNADIIDTTNNIFRLVYDNSEILRFNNNEMYPSSTFNIGTSAKRITDIYTTKLYSNSVILTGDLDMSDSSHKLLIGDNDLDALIIGQTNEDYITFDTTNNKVIFNKDVDINSGTIDGTPIGSNSKSSGGFNSLVLTGDLDMSDSSHKLLIGDNNLNSLIIGQTNEDYITFDTTNNKVIFNKDVDINSGTIDGTPIGSNSKSSGGFNSLVLTGDLDMSDSSHKLLIGDNDLDALVIGQTNEDYITFDTTNNIVDFNKNIQISGGTIDGTPIGSNSASSGSFTTLTLNGSNISATANEINILDGDTSTSSITSQGSDSIVYNDSGVMKQVSLDTIDTYFSTTTKTIQNKTITNSTATLSSLTVDSIVIDSFMIGTNNDTDLLTLSDNSLTVSGKTTTNTLNISGTDITATASEINTLDISANTQTITDNGSIILTSTFVKLYGSQSGYNVSLASPTTAQHGKIMTIQLQDYSSYNISLDMTNIIHSNYNNSINFSSINDTVVLIGSVNKWVVLIERVNPILS